MDPSHTAANFQSTIWSLVLGAGRGGDRAHLEQLLRAYWSPVYAFIRRQGYTGHDASDLTQDFMTQVVLSRDLIGRADPAKGRFRSFLKQALRNFLVDQHRLGKAHKGRQSGRGGPNGPTHVELDASCARDGGAAAKTPRGPLDDSFDRAWAAAVVEITLSRLEEACLADGLDAHWTAFNLNVLGPALRRTTALPLTDLARRINATDDAQASNMLQTMKRRFRRILREVIAETVNDPSQVEDELGQLRDYFGA
ncbi:MAG TPA: sigma factor [Phycisphaerales bacterium]|nr:sigma factor [Phycisphaerales bacterium]